MTPTDEITALRRVVAAHRAHKTSLLYGDLPFITRRREAELFAALDALAALPAASPPAVGEVVEMAVWINDQGAIAQRLALGFSDNAETMQGWVRLGTVRLALIPTSDEPK
jgi:hypothetical protein